MILATKKNPQSVINIPSFDVNEISLDLIKQQVNIKEILSNKSRFLTLIDPQGEVNFTSLFADNSAKEEPKPTKNPEKKQSGKPWVVDIANINFKDYTVDFTMETEGNPVKLNLTPINLSINDFKTVPGNQFNLDLNIGVNESGNISSKGKVGIDPVITALDVQADKLAIKPFQPFLDQSTKLEIVSGLVNVDNKVNFSQSSDGKNILNVTGNVSINKLKTVEKNTSNKFLGWQAVLLNDLKFSLDPMSLDIAAIDINKISSKVIINKDKSTNLSKIFSSPDGSDAKENPEKKEPPKSEEKTKEDPAFALNIGTIKFKDGETYFADKSLILPFAVNIKKLKGKVSKISTDTKTRSSINLAGKVNRVSPVLIKGSLSPFDFQNYLDMSLKFKGLDMTTATPYMAEFAGYKIEKGKLTLDLNYKIKRKKLNATNQVILNQLTLGDEIESPNSVSLPLKLGIGLLKDADGVIDLNLPIEGSLDDPQFSVFGLVGKVLLNLITKAVTSPFSMMGDLLGTDADLSQVIFSKGSPEIGDEQIKILTPVAEGLKKRPQLQLEIKGIAYQEEDALGLAEKQIEWQIKTELWKDLDEDERPASIKDVKLEGEDYLELLVDQFEDKFSDSDELVDKAEDAETPEQAKPFYDEIKQKLVSTVTIKKSRLEQLAKQRAANISDFLSQQTIDVERVFVLGEEILPKTENGNISTSLNLIAQ